LKSENPREIFRSDEYMYRPTTELEKIIVGGRKSKAWRFYKGRVSREGKGANEKG